MNRAQRRATERSARRHHKPAREVNVPAPMAVKMQFVLAPLERILDEIENNGTVDVSGSTPIFQPLGESAWFASAPAILGVVDLFDMWAKRHDKRIDTSPLSRLAHKLEYSMPIAQDDIDTARSTMTTLRRMALLMTHDEATDLIQQTRIKDALEAQA